MTSPEVQRNGIGDSGKSISAVSLRERAAWSQPSSLAALTLGPNRQHIPRIVPSIAQRGAAKAHPKWSGKTVSNRRHRTWKVRALTTELFPQICETCNRPVVGAASRQIVKEPLHAGCWYLSLWQCDHCNNKKRPGTLWIPGLWDSEIQGQCVRHFPPAFGNPHSSSTTKVGADGRGCLGWQTA